MAGALKATATDIPVRHWSDRLAPTAARPYLRLARVDRPIGTWLLLFPCWWGLALAGAAGHGWPDWRYAALFAAGALVMRGAGCTFNDIVDRDLDGRVARTAGRPIPSGQISLTQAVAFLGLQMLAGLLVLAQFNTLTIALGIASLALVFTYPFMKRVTYWPQAFLGLTFNWGALLGWTASTGGLDWPPVILYIGCIAWTLGYDTIYAHQDKEDDALIGVKSTALKFGAESKPWILLFYAAAAVLLALAGTAAGLSWPYYLAVAAVAAQFAWQVFSLNIDDAKNCLRIFKSNRVAGWLLLAGLLAATWAE